MPARVETFCGLVFVNLDVDAQPLGEQLTGLERRLAPYGIRRVEEYRAAGFPLLPVVKGVKRTKWQMIPYVVLLVPAGSIPRTSSGKIARRACKTAYVEGTLRGGYQQQAFPDSV